MELGRVGVPTGARVGRYRLVQRIGEGGMGVVYLAVTDDGRAVAVKVLRPHVAGDADARRRLAREVSSLRRVRHPLVAEVLDADTECETPYIVTRYVPGHALDAHVREHGALGVEQLAQLGDGLGEALVAIHATGVVHRDLKPGNVLMLDGDPVVIDFGIAHVADDVRLTSTGLVMGTPGYLSPEVVAGEAVSQATDWWGWAATMAFAGSGRPPFGRGPLEVVLDRVRRGETDLAGVPPVLAAALERALAVDPADRPAPGVLRAAVAELRARAQEPWTVEVPVDREPRTELVRTSEVPVDREPRTELVRTSEVPVDREAVTSAMRVGRADGATPPVDDVTSKMGTPPLTRELPRMPRPEPRDAGEDTEAIGTAPPPSLPATDRPRPRRSGTLAVGMLAFVGTAAVAPVAAALFGLALVVLARTVDRSRGSLLRRRYESGPRRADGAMTAIAIPWHLVVAAATAVPTLLLPALVGASVTFITGFAVETSNPAPGQSLPLAVGAAAASVTAWLGPGGGALRHGIRIVVRAVSPGRASTQVFVVLLILVVVASVIVAARNGGEPDWAPLVTPPL